MADWDQLFQTLQTVRQLIPLLAPCWPLLRAPGRNHTWPRYLLAGGTIHHRLRGPRGLCAQTSSTAHACLWHGVVYRLLKQQRPSVCLLCTRDGSGGRSPRPRAFHPQLRALLQPQPALGLAHLPAGPHRGAARHGEGCVGAGKSSPYAPWPSLPSLPSWPLPALPGCEVCHARAVWRACVWLTERVTEGCALVRAQATPKPIVWDEVM